MINRSTKLSTRRAAYNAGLILACRYSTNTPITHHSYIHGDFMSSYSKEEIAKHLKNLGPFPTYSNILNPQHFYQNQVLLEYSKKLPHPVSLRQLAGYGNTLTKQKIINSANFVRIEIPIRLAMRIRDLQTLPFGVVNNFHLAQIYESYYHSFNAFRKISKIETIEQNNRFCETVSKLLDDHVFNLSHLMMGALEVSIAQSLPQEDLDKFMSVMLRSRISRRVIAEEHLSLSENYNKNPYDKKPPHYLGEIFNQCNAVDHFNIVANMVKSSMAPSFPEIERLPDLEIDGDLDATFQFMVPHLHYMLHEILRNSFEATIKTHSKKTSKILPPVKVTIVNSDKHVLFRISDQGGGIAHDKLKKIWSFGKSPDQARKSLANFHTIPGLQLYSNLKVTAAGSSIVTTEATDALHASSLSEQTGRKKSTLEHFMARPYELFLGMGLPMCHVYVDYWNGELSMNSLEGYGCDTSLTLSKLGYHSTQTQLDRA
ncbi:putative pyruvate dehydrogenase kinase [Spathaspora passalidarum NRRL Y-27907]|uniref:Protein-serine/threonine kinase n=1 Tax=Spathaspora passalidarum (strain NRRL Y-27907 / 11-Y1) TaxID=619300 RepID=G3ANU9_SPAPN|nr:putative pyruvate dehydrogenase kinase [Spathaspora passalidarum NRRL Y-27907]EGW32574.1 putative pyruvate dehydrogenase kinase [Spathaspora passalidarum NRRL Y-27907]